MHDHKNHYILINVDQAFAAWDISIKKAGKSFENTKLMLSKILPAWTVKRSKTVAVFKRTGIWGHLAYKDTARMIFSLSLILCGCFFFFLLQEYTDRFSPRGKFTLGLLWPVNGTTLSRSDTHKWTKVALRGNLPQCSWASRGPLCSNSRDLTALNPDYMGDIHSATCLHCPSGGDLSRGLGHRLIDDTVRNATSLCQS